MLLSYFVFRISGITSKLEHVETCDGSIFQLLYFISRLSAFWPLDPRVIKRKNNKRIRGYGFL